MARATLSVTPLSRSGITPAAGSDGDPVDGHLAANTGQTIIVVQNTSTDTPYDVTFVTPGTVDGQPIGDRVEAVPASTTRWFGRFPTGVYGSAVLVDVENAALKLSAFEP